MADLLKLGIIYKALEKYMDLSAWAGWSQAMYELLGKPYKPGCAIKALAIVEHDRILNGRN